MSLSRKSLAALFSFALFVLPLAAGARAAGGGVAGSVTDPKGAAVAGAAVAVTDVVSGQSFNAVTDAQGRYRVEGLPAGTYVVTVSAEGFAEFRQQGVKVEEGKSTPLDARLEIAPVDAGSVTVSASGLKANSDPVYQQLRRLASVAGDFGGDYAKVTDLVLRREAAVFTLRSGELYFLKPVEGRSTGAVFVGDGEVALAPPSEEERHSLAIFTEQPTLTESFTQLVLRFTDETPAEVKASPNAVMGTAGAQAERARDIYRANQTLLRKELRTNADLRTLVDLYSSAQRPGFFTAFITGRRFEKLVYEVDPLGLPYVSPEQVALSSRGTTDGGIWTSFYMADEYRKRTADSRQDRRLSDITKHEIDAAIRGARLVVTDRITLRARASGARVLPFDLYPSLRVSRVQDEQGADLNFVQESKNEDGDFGVIFAQQTQAAKTYKLTVQYEGDGAVRDFGGGNYILNPAARGSWYPSSGGTQFGDRALFEMTFRYPKGNTFVGTGAPAGAEAQEGDQLVARWTSGATELAVAGFNYGKFKKKEVADKDSGYNVEFYANTDVAPQIRSRQMQERMIESATGRSIEQLTGGELTSTGNVSTTAGADGALAETQNSVRIFNAYFGKLPYTRIAMTQQPAEGFGQSWPTLVYMPFTAFMNTTERVALFGARGGTDTFWEYVGPHEVAHQWFGHITGWTSYRDQWMSEGFSEFAASLYVQFVRKDTAKFIDFWEEQRKLIVEATPATKGRRPYTVGPVTLGYRLNSGKTGNVARRMIYPKGAYILHMLRMLMYDRQTGDARFQAMMQDFIKTNYNKDVSTEDFKRVVDRHTTPEADLEGNKRMDWFFRQWVYGTEVPAYTFDYQLNGNTLSGRITQSGVGPGFRMLVPVYADFGKGWVRLGSATLVGNSSQELSVPLPQAPRRAAVAALNDVLATSVQNNKR